MGYVPGNIGGRQARSEMGAVIVLGSNEEAALYPV